jgi:hypothetical protein
MIVVFLNGSKIEMNHGCLMEYIVHQFRFTVYVYLFQKSQCRDENVANIQQDMQILHSEQRVKYRFVLNYPSF